MTTTIRPKSSKETQVTERTTDHEGSKGVSTKDFIKRFFKQGFDDVSLHKTIITLKRNAVNAGVQQGGWGFDLGGKSVYHIINCPKTLGERLQSHFRYIRIDTKNICLPMRRYRA